ncbi:MAG: hypothetical protein ABI619_08115 [Betaproteobacteria bacterium]
MTDSTILYAGIFCFSLILAGFSLTIYEFKRMERTQRRVGGKPSTTPIGAARSRTA